MASHVLSDHFVVDNRTFLPDLDDLYRVVIQSHERGDTPYRISVSHLGVTFPPSPRLQLAGALVSAQLVGLCT